MEKTNYQQDEPTNKQILEYLQQLDNEINYKLDNL